MFKFQYSKSEEYKDGYMYNYLKVNALIEYPIISNIYFIKTLSVRWLCNPSESNVAFVA